MDTLTTAQRSYNMSRIRSKDTKPELLVRKFLFANGYRYRLHARHLPGKPDIVLPKYRTMIFIHGCFWHGHRRCKYFKMPQTRTEWWTEKINRNRANDTRAITALKKAGWKVLVIWECEVKKNKLEKTLEKLFFKLKK